MIRLLRRWNQRVIELGGIVPRFEFVEWVDDDGRVHTAHWRGYIGADKARQLEGARSVRLVVLRVEGRRFNSGRRLEPTEYVEGCLVGREAWAVVYQRIRIVPGPEPRRDEQGALVTDPER